MSHNYRKTRKTKLNVVAEFGRPDLEKFPNSCLI